MLDGTYDPTFTLRLTLKDFDLVMARAEEAGTPVPVSAYVRDRFRAAAERYGTDKGYLSILRFLEEETGVLLRW